MNNFMEKYLGLIGLLSEVLSSMEDSDNGFVSPDIYMKIRKALNDTEEIPKVMQKQINTWRELYGEDSIPR